MLQMKNLSGRVEVWLVLTEVYLNDVARNTLDRS